MLVITITRYIMHFSSTKLLLSKNGLKMPKRENISKNKFVLTTLELTELPPLI